MHLLETDINYYLLLDNFIFKNPENNIEYLNCKAIASIDLKEKLLLLTQATKLVEKFHSYFHFEQSFFHLQLALIYLKEGLQDKAKIELDSAIFQDHINQQALALSTNSSIFEEYKRPHQTFMQYLTFATNDLDPINIDNYNPYNYWKDSLLEQNISTLKAIIDKIKYLHLHYHQEAAKLYLNRALIFHQLNSSLLAQNDLVKANNLDNKLKDKEYYPVILSQMSKIVVLGLGSNLGNRKENLENAIKKLENLNILFNINCSGIEETEALLLPDSPHEWNINYLNLVLKGYTRLSPLELLKTLKDIEISIGRKESPKWSPREIDIDILAYEDITFNQDELHIPHPELLNRPWLLKHFIEIYPEWKYPVSGTYYHLTIKEIYERT